MMMLIMMICKTCRGNIVGVGKGGEGLNKERTNVFVFHWMLDTERARNRGNMCLFLS